jgi:hypothetical protein
MVPTTPALEANQMRPSKSGSAEMTWSVSPTAVVRSRSASWAKASRRSATMSTWRVVVGITARSRSSR